MSLLPGIIATRVPTSRLTSNVLSRSDANPDGVPLVLVHGNVSSSLFFQPFMLSLPAAVNVVAIDLRGYGDTDTLPVDATRGVRDWSDDVAEVIDELGLAPAHILGWSMGGGVVMQYAIDHPVRSLTLLAPVSPYGFGGTALDGSLLNPDASGTGGGGANPDFVERLRTGDRSAEAITSPRSTYAATYVKPGFVSEYEEIWIDSMLSTAVGEDNYPGDSTPSEHWPGFGPGARGVLNTMSPLNLDLSGIVGLDPKPPILWIHGADDLIVSDNSFFDLNFLGQLGLIPDWPGADVAPPQPMKAQTRAVFNAYAAAGGSYRELELADCGHSAHVEHPDEVRAALLSHIGVRS